MVSSCQYTRMLTAVKNLNFTVFSGNQSLSITKVLPHTGYNSCFSRGSRLIITCRHLSNNTSNQDKRDTSSKAIAETRQNPYSHLTLGGKVKQASKDVYYTGIVIVGIGVTGLMFYAIFRELFSKSSPNSVYTNALEQCRKNARVIDTLGEPIKGYGELSARGRRRHINHLEYILDGVNHMRMQFYLEGSRKKGTVHLEAVEEAKGGYEFRYLFVDIDGYPKQTIIIQDNRYSYDKEEPLSSE